MFAVPSVNVPDKYIGIIWIIKAITKTKQIYITAVFGSLFFKHVSPMRSFFIVSYRQKD